MERPMTPQGMKYLKLHQEGFTNKEIADMCGVNPSSVCRALKRALRKTCPFSPDCRKCPLPECAFKEEYMMLVNNTQDVRTIGKRTKQYI